VQGSFILYEKTEWNKKELHKSQIKTSEIILILNRILVYET